MFKEFTDALFQTTSNSIPSTSGPSYAAKLNTDRDKTTSNFIAKKQLHPSVQLRSLQPSLHNEVEPMKIQTDTTQPSAKFTQFTSNEYINNINNIIKKNSIEDEDDLHRCIKKINNYIQDNPDINEIDTKVLNGEISLKGYVFCKKGGQQQILKKQYIPMSRSKTKPLLDKISVLEDRVDSLEEHINYQEDYIKK